MSTFEQIGLAIRAKRNQLGMTQEQLAQRCGMEKPDISNIENGKRNMTLDTLDRIAEAVECDVRILFDEIMPDPDLWKEYKGTPPHLRAWIKLSDGSIHKVVLSNQLSQRLIYNHDQTAGWDGDRSMITHYQPITRRN